MSFKIRGSIAALDGVSAEAGVVSHGYDLNATNTGVQSGVTLTPSGTVTSTVDGQVIENLDVSGSVRIRHDNVTVRNCKIDGQLSSNYGIDFSTGTPVTGTVVEYCEIIRCASAGIVHFSPYTMRWCQSHNHPADGAKFGNASTIEYCWIYGLYQFESSHNDCIQMRNGNNSNIRFNRLECIWQNQTGALLAQAADSDISNLTVEGNFFSGGSYSVYMREPSEQLDTVLIKDNLWAANSASAGPYSEQSGVTNITKTGNQIAPVTQGGAGVHPVLIDESNKSPYL